MGRVAVEAARRERAAGRDCVVCGINPRPFGCGFIPSSATYGSAAITLPRRPRFGSRAGNAPGRSPLSRVRPPSHPAMESIPGRISAGRTTCPRSCTSYRKRRTSGPAVRSRKATSAMTMTRRRARLTATLSSRAPGAIQWCARISADGRAPRASSTHNMTVSASDPCARCTVEIFSRDSVGAANVTKLPMREARPANDTGRLPVRRRPSGSASSTSDAKSRATAHEQHYAGCAFPGVSPSADRASRYRAE